MTKNITIAVLIMLVCFLLVNLLVLRTQFKEMSALIDSGYDIVTECNNKLIDDFYLEISSFHKYYGDATSESHFPNMKKLRSSMDKLRKINIQSNPEVLTELIILNKEKKNFTEADNDFIKTSSDLVNVQNLVKAINTNKVIDKIAIPFFDNQFGKDEFEFSKNISKFVVQEYDTLKIPITMVSLSYRNSGVYSLVDSLNFRKTDSNSGEFLIPIGRFRNGQSNIHKERIKYFVNDNINEEIFLSRIENIEYEITKLTN